MRELTICTGMRQDIGRNLPAFGEEDADVGVPEVERRGLPAVAIDEAAAVDEE